ncbi:cell death abnormality protein 1-like [Gigantopelta aegis]|uniref:cell death abnormality protein 1-like n=1 Tax=Gigantopelta aegis TaxID=1735272 RepID=UPI001B889185|nr:cell death abnormality protein 1-like [Gigantopelta aegis]
MRHCKNNNSPCDSRTGECVGGCKPGWINTTCTQQCNDGKYGMNCNATCGECANEICDRVTGNCTDGCSDGFEGHLCKELERVVKTQNGQTNGAQHDYVNSSHPAERSEENDNHYDRLDVAVIGEGSPYSTIEV